MIGRRDIFFRARFALFHTHASLLTSFVCFFILFHSCCSNAQVFGKTLVHEFPVSYIAILNGTFFFRSVKAMNNWKRSAIKQILLLLLLFPCCSSVYFCCSHVLCHCVQVSLVIRMLMSILYSDWFIWDRHVCYLWLVSWLADLLFFARKASFCLLYGLVVMYSAVLILMLIFSLYLTSMNK